MAALGSFRRRVCAERAVLVFVFFAECAHAWFVLLFSTLDDSPLLPPAAATASALAALAAAPTLLRVCISLAMAARSTAVFFCSGGRRVLFCLADIGGFWWCW